MPTDPYGANAPFRTEIYWLRQQDVRDLLGRAGHMRTAERAFWENFLNPEPQLSYK